MYSNYIQLSIGTTQCYRLLCRLLARRGANLCSLECQLLERKRTHYARVLPTKPKSNRPLALAGQNPWHAMYRSAQLWGKEYTMPLRMGKA